MRAILINPYDQTITEVSHNGDYRQIYELLTEPETHVVDLFTTVRVDQKHNCFVDDEGLLTPGRKTFEALFYPYQPLAGRGLILGARGADTVGCTIPLDDVVKMVTWTDLKTTAKFSSPTTKEYPGVTVHDMGRPFFKS